MEKNKLNDLEIFKKLPEIFEKEFQEKFLPDLKVIVFYPEEIRIVRSMMYSMFLDGAMVMYTGKTYRQHYEEYEKPIV